MLSTLDTIIAFAVIMTVLSLLITIIVQMVSAALSLRGKNLANALSLTFQTIDPNIGEHAHSLAAQILRDPIFSDSLWNKRARPVLNDKARAFISAQRNLNRARLLPPAHAHRAKAVNDAEAAVKEAEANLQLTTVKDNRKKPWNFWSWPWGGAMQVASAIRPGEIYRLIQEIAAMSETEAQLRDVPKDLIEPARQLLALLQESDGPALESRAKLRDIANLSKEFSSEQQKAVVDALANFGATFDRATTQAYDRFQRWFGSAQDRAEQWFQMHMRMITIAAAIVLTSFLQLDTLDIYRQLRDQPKLAEALVKSAPGVVEQGERLQTEAVTPDLKARRQAFEDLRKTLDQTGFELVPKQFLGRWAEEQTPDSLGNFKPWLAILFKHFVGLTITAVLLTLGAPFWFNLLKNLMNLRPAVASLIEKRPTSAPALPPAPATPPSSS